MYDDQRASLETPGKENNMTTVNEMMHDRAGHADRMPELRIGDITARVPVIQGGMGVGISLSGLASAVANEGGIGVIASVGIAMLSAEMRNVRKQNIEKLKSEIRKAKTMTDGIIGVNIMVALTDFAKLVMVSFEAEADIVFLGAGLPLRIPQIVTPERLREGKTKTAVIVSSDRAAAIVLRSWAKYDCVPDALVVEGPMAGGHLGFKKAQIDDSQYSLEAILPGVIAAVKPFEDRFGKEIPVIAAGGIYTGADIRKYLDLGAGGVQMATRFVTTHECDADIKFKEAFLAARKEDITIIQSPVGLPGRAINNAFLKDVKAGQKKPFHCPWKCLATCDFRTAPYCIAQALVNAQQGNLDDGFVFAGANAYRATEITSVHEIFKSLTEEYAASILQLQAN